MIDINTQIHWGLHSLLKNETYLLANNTSERSITHKLGEHLQLIFPEWNVDCEFNRNLDGPKVLKDNAKLFLKGIADYIEGESRSTKIHELLCNAEMGSKEVDQIIEQLRNPKLEYDEEFDTLYHILKVGEDKFKKTIYPDIIIHHRGTKNNLVVIEAKKSFNIRQFARFYDLAKLLALTNSPDYLYQYGFFIDIPTGLDFDKFKHFTFDKMAIDQKVTIVKPVYY